MLVVTPDADAGRLAAARALLEAAVARPPAGATAVALGHALAALGAWERAAALARGLGPPAREALERWLVAWGLRAAGAAAPIEAEWPDPDPGVAAPLGAALADVRAVLDGAWGLRADAGGGRLRVCPSREGPSHASLDAVRVGEARVVLVVRRRPAELALRARGRGGGRLLLELPLDRWPGAAVLADEEPVGGRVVRLEVGRGEHEIRLLLPPSASGEAPPGTGSIPPRARR